ncbi:MAG: hypothetical protein H6605_07470 [Flavobacteriales bacterium]|nr:hypothetical protein [Flavobacteriales bacterium]
MKDLKTEFQSWYETSFKEVYDQYEPLSEDAELLRALFPAFELAALRHFEGKALKRNHFLKWNYFLLCKREQQYFIKENEYGNFDVLLWPSQPKHYFLQKAVYDQLKKMDIKVGFVTNTVSIQSSFNNDKVDFVNVHTKKKSFISIGPFLQNQKLLRKVSASKTFTSGNRKIRLKALFREALTFRNPVDKTLNIYSEILKFKNPSFVLTGYSFSTVTLALDQRCKNAGIQTGSIQMGRMMYYLFKYSHLQVLYSYGKEVTDAINKLKGNTESIEVGSIKIEVTENSAGKEQVQELCKEARKHFKKLALIAFSGPGLTVSFNGHTENLKALKTIIESQTDTFFIIKFHGKDRMAYYSEIKMLDNVLIINKQHPVIQYDIMHLIKECDLLMTGASTTLIEAAYWKKPCISLDCLRELQHIDLVNEAFVYNCKDSGDLNSAIESIYTNNEKHQEKMKQMEVFISYAFRKGEQPPSFYVAEDIQKRIAKS